jgi:hypothetical protein
MPSTKIKATQPAEFLAILYSLHYSFDSMLFVALQIDCQFEEAIDISVDGI